MNRVRMIERGPAPMQTIGNKIRHRREALGLTRRAVAESSGIHMSSISCWEIRGVPTTFSLHDAQQLAHALDVSADWIMDERPSHGLSTEAACAGDTLRAQLEAAGQRARIRRENLGVARSRLARQLQIRDRVLSQWENDGLPNTINPDQVEAWEKALKVEPGWLLGEHNTSALAKSTTGEVSSTHSAAEIIVAVGRALASGRQWSTVERNAELFAMRYGIGAQGRTLASVATQHGITESRACQILSQMHANARDIPPAFVDAFRAIDATARQHLPCSPERLEAVLRPLLGEGPTIKDAWRFARDYLDTHLLTLEAHLFSVPDRARAGDERTRTVHEMAEAMISAVGAAHIGVLMGYAVELGWELDAIRAIREQVQTGHGFEWLDRPERAAQEWFWYGESARHNPVTQALRRVCSIADAPFSLDVALGAVERLRDLRLSREERCHMQYPVPPAFVATAILSRLRFVAGSHGRYRPTVRLDPKTELTAHEHRLYKAFLRRGPSVTWNALASELVDTGQIGEVTLRALLSRSSIIQTLSPGVWALRGVGMKSCGQAPADCAT